MIKRIHIFGASGSGVSTLGKSLSKRLKIKCFDSDDYYWKKTDPPFIEAEPLEIRERNYLVELGQSDEWICAGSLVSWGDEIKELFDLAVYLYVPSEIRLERLAKREKKNFGQRVELGGDMYENHLKFLDWASGYDHSEFSGRNLLKHRNWMETLKCPVIKYEGNFDAEELALKVHRKIVDMELRQLIDKKIKIQIDRPFGSIHPRHPNLIYELNYGFVPNTLSLDGHEIDAYILGVSEPLDSFEGKCIGYIQRDDDDDPKLLVVNEESYFDDSEVIKMTHFQEQYFKSKIIR